MAHARLLGDEHPATLQSRVDLAEVYLAQGRLAEALEMLEQVSRTAKGRTRPLLENGDPRRILEDLLKIRDPLYREIADLVVETDGRKVKSVADEIIDNLA